MEEKECLERCKGGDQSARNMLIEHNMRLVAHVVKKYQCPDYETEDLLSVGTIGLIKAVNTFNADKGSKLATYAARCVENEVLMKLRSNKKLAREVSLYEPIGVDKDGETVSLMDVDVYKRQGRGIVIGETGDGRYAVTAYFIMGRSANSRNRVFVTEGEGIRTQAFDPEKLEDPSLIIYAPVRVLGNKTIVTNGDQTDTIYEGMDHQLTFEQSLRSREFEPDAPNYTPRILSLIHI